MNTEIILKVDKLENLVQWLAHNVCGTKPTYARALYMFANKPGTSLGNDAMDDYSKFDNGDEAKKYIDALCQTKFIIKSKLVEESTWTHNKGMETEYKTVTQIWKITAIPAANNIEDAFNMYCAKPYNPA